MPVECLGYQQVTSLSSAQTLTIPTGKAPTYVLLQAETQSIRFRDDGTNPTASVGLRIVKDLAPFKYEGDIKALAFIEETTSAKLNVGYYRVVP